MVERFFKFQFNKSLLKEYEEKEKQKEKSRQERSAKRGRTLAKGTITRWLETLEDPNAEYNACVDTVIQMYIWTQEQGTVENSRIIEVNNTMLMSNLKCSQFGTSLRIWFAIGNNECLTQTS